MKPLIYVHWRDAMFEEATQGGPVDAPQLIDLHEIGWLVAEDEQAVCLSMELEPGPDDGDGNPTSQAGRSRLHIPKVNIVESREVDWKKAFPKRSIR